MSLLKKIALLVFSLVILVVIINVGLNFWLNKKLPIIISDKNPTSYTITYSNLEINLLSKKIKASKLIIAPKTKQLENGKKLNIYSKIESIEISGFKVWDILFNDRIKANTIIITAPEIVVEKDSQNAINNSKNLGSAVVKPFQEIIMVSNIILNRGKLKIMNTTTDKPILSLNNINFRINNIIVTDDLLQNKIPFSYQNFAIKTDSIYYRLNNNYHLKASNLVASDKDFSVEKFEMIPEYSRSQFTNKLDKEKDLFTLRSESIKINNIDWGFKDDKPFFNANSVIIDQLSANIYRNKLPPDDLSKKPLYNALLRDLKFPLKIDTLAIRNSLLVYEEEINFQKGPGKLSFNKFNLKATNIQSGFQQKKLADVAIDINCKFMNHSPLKLHWTFNVLDQKDHFTIHGNVSNLKTSDLTTFTKPYLNATTQGIIDELKFTIKGNDFNSYEDASLKYHGLKVTLYRKGAPEKKNKLKSALANLIVKNDTSGQTINTTATVERDQEKSFYNFLWINIAAILKQIII
ncbi:hypothetical protein [Flavobacterium hiemivividum]|uniref:DUF748 domain-containing protein n=1 Tax=Flavobacterium hiemivividum TaxID=2541734 RepID=A0A4R5CVB7_9FLAO|nr:hypothetical protein [Flavobacterium hiemivividum]TDE02951.1 hypothetical protein E0F98_12270 [Flavobacterium hiemivividum]